jgi:hypothetical protein
MSYNTGKYNTRSHSKYYLNKAFLIDWLIGNGKKQTQLATILGMCKQRMSYVINNERVPLSVVLYPKLVRALEELGVQDTTPFFVEVDDV